MRHGNHNPDRWAHWEELLWLLAGRDAGQKLGEINAIRARLRVDGEQELTAVPHRKGPRKAHRVGKAASEKSP